MMMDEGKIQVGMSDPEMGEGRKNPALVTY